MPVCLLYSLKFAFSALLRWMIYGRRVRLQPGILLVTDLFEQAVHIQQTFTVLLHRYQPRAEVIPLSCVRKQTFCGPASGSKLVTVVRNIKRGMAEL